MIRFVFDTNTIVSALLFRQSVPRQAFDRALSSGTILTSEPLVMELSRVLALERFDSYVSLEERNEFLEALILNSDLVEITESVQACRDPDDDRILEVAVNGAAAYIVTGDSDLLVMNPFRGVEILTPAELLRPSRSQLSN